LGAQLTINKHTNPRPLSTGRRKAQLKARRKEARLCHQSSGKTTLTLHAIPELQKQDGTAAFIDASTSRSCSPSVAPSI